MTIDIDRAAAETFAAENLAACAAEIIEWQDTAILCDGKVRELARLCRKFAGSSELRIAESFINRAAVERAASAPPVILAVPEGWKLVPIEPTEEMMLTAHGYDVFKKLRAVAPSAISIVAKSIYKDMLAAAPALQEGSEQPPENQQEGMHSALRAEPAGQLCIDRQELRQLSIRLVEDGAMARSEHYRDGVTHGVFGLHKAILKLAGAAPVEQTTSTDINNEKGQA